MMCIEIKIGRANGRVGRIIINIIMEINIMDIMERIIILRNTQGKIMISTGKEDGNIIVERIIIKEARNIAGNTVINIIVRYIYYLIS